MSGVAGIIRHNQPEAWERQVSLRWLAVFALATMAHGVPMAFLALPAVPRLADEPAAFAVSFTPSSAAAEALESAADAEPLEAASAIPPALAAAPEISPSQPPAPAVTETPPPAPEVAQVTPPPAAKEPEPPKLVQPDLAALVAKPTVAFDESKATPEPPKDPNAYLSDRNTTAADRGPKDLPRGDPFMDKGESKLIRYAGRRGEENVPAFKSPDTSGSVKKEGNPDAGKGPLLDQRPLVKEEPAKAVARNVETTPPAETPHPQPLSLKGRGETEAKASAAPPAPASVPQRSTLDTVEGEGELLHPARKVEPKQPVAAPVAKTDAKSNDDNEARPGFARAANSEQRLPVAHTPQAKKLEPPDELAAFKALLDGKSSGGGRGESGTQAGVAGRKGARGHEGDGTLRPGSDDAVSDVNTINLDSSAAEFDEARFAKRFDARTAYVKPLARRIDNKWKAERVARNRVRLSSGVVTFRIVVRRDGKLLEATEVSRSPSGIPDEYSAMAKVAIERAAEPLSEPFPAELNGNETLEFVFNFLY